ncbi:hypothetical protein [Bacillus wiedmannii]|uniref:hypothetical protein n=1 Tax=Bacillus wiedmannii TaxID=1890302 RepID=UPI000BF06000|nr:hypothetical protein [Bacillus wiedmannii]PEN61598.1 hypothetical protein CN576_21420 [Bacillus wiedmannii]PHA62844.1 hypothetical protein COE75_16525 [Bacillus wiedmannii]
MDHYTKSLIQKAQKARTLYHLKQISRDEAKVEIMPYVNEFNRKSKEIAKRFNQSPKLTTFSNFIR